MYACVVAVGEPAKVRAEDPREADGEYQSSIGDGTDTQQSTSGKEANRLTGIIHSRPSLSLLLFSLPLTLAVLGYPYSYGDHCDYHHRGSHSRRGQRCIIESS